MSKIIVVLLLVALVAVVTLACTGDQKPCTTNEECCSGVCRKNYFDRLQCALSVGGFPSFDIEGL